MRLGRWSLAVAAVVPFMLGASAPAAAHGWDYVFASHDYVRGGVQGHGGIVTRYQHRGRYHVYVHVKACWGRCRFAVTSEGRTYYVGGGRVQTLASNSGHCSTPPYRWYNEGYTCDAMTRVVSNRRAAFCWTEVFGYATNRATRVVHSGLWSSNLGNCR
jgi:hypothetical protein